MALFQELKRRNVFRVGIAYAVTAWLLIQVGDIVFDAIDAPPWVMKAMMFILAAGLPLVLAFSWAYELTPEGVKREAEVDRSRSITAFTARRLDYIIIGLLILALGAFAWDRLHFSRTTVPDAGTALATRVEPSDPDRTGETQPEGRGTQSAGSSGTSIAVLPFVNLSADAEQEYFSDGISEELLNVLAKYPDLRVAARTSSFQFKGENRDITDIARQLKVNHVLEGSVRKSGTRLRITAQLIDAESGFHLWSETYDRELDDVFAIQDEISAAIGEALQAELALSPDQAGAAPRVAHSDNTAAYEAFLQGRHLINQRGNKNIRDAVDHLQRCVRLDPDFAPCHAWLSIGYVLLLSSPGTYGDLTLAEVKERAIPEYEIALELDPNLAEAHGAKALLANNSNDYGVALTHTARALELNPVYVDALNWQQIAASALGEYGQSWRVIERILEIDPLSIIGRLNFASRGALKHPERTRRYAESLIADNPWAGYTAMSFATSIPSGDYSTGLEWALKAYRIAPEDEFLNQGIKLTLALVGEYDEARRISGLNLHMVDLEEGRPELAISRLELELQADPENSTPRTNLADAYYTADQCGEAIRLYDRLLADSSSGLILDTFSGSTASLVRMAYCLARLGLEERSREAISRHDRDFAKRGEADLLFGDDYYAEAMARTVKGDAPGAVAALRDAMSIGFRRMSLFDEPIFSPIADQDAMQALKAEMQRLLDIERAEILQLICHNNPAYDTWQPRRETCENVPILH